MLEGAFLNISTSKKYGAEQTRSDVRDSAISSREQKVAVTELPKLESTAPSASKRKRLSLEVSGRASPKISGTTCRGIGK